MIRPDEDTAIAQFLDDGDEIYNFHVFRTFSVLLRGRGHARDRCLRPCFSVVPDRRGSCECLAPDGRISNCTGRGRQQVRSIQDEPEDLFMHLLLVRVQIPDRTLACKREKLPTERLPFVELPSPAAPCTIWLYMQCTKLCNLADTRECELGAGTCLESEW